MKPMCAATIKDIQQVVFPVYASPKLDGIRAVVIDGKLRSRSLKPIPNGFVNELFGRNELDGYDGELILGEPTAVDVFRKTTSAVTTERFKPAVSFYVFDNYKARGGFEKRIQTLSNGHRVVQLEQRLVKTQKELLTYEEKILDKGFEGLMLRAPHGPYKYGRSTMNEQWMMKLKRFTDAEATVIDMDEEISITGDPKGRMGALVCRLESGIQFNVGTGFDDTDRDWFWKNRRKIVKEKTLIKFKSFMIGVKDKPRHPVYLGLRHKWDL